MGHPNVSLLTATDDEISAAERLSNMVNGYAFTYKFDELTHYWIAVRLADGRSDGVLYESRRDAIAHQPNENWCAYLFLRECAQGMTVRDAHAFLGYHRAAYEAGYRLPDPDDRFKRDSQMVMPLTRRDIGSEVRNLLTIASGNPYVRG